MTFPVVLLKQIEIVMASHFSPVVYVCVVCADVEESIVERA